MVPVNTVLASRPGWKMTPGERTSWLTTTRSVPLMMKVPRLVIIGKSPMKTVCSLISPVEAFMNRARTEIGVARVELELEAELVGEVGDRAYVGKRLSETAVEKPLE